MGILFCRVNMDVCSKSISSRTVSIKISSTTSRVGNGTPKSANLAIARASHSVKMCMGVSSHPSSSQSLHYGLSLSLVMERCFCHQPWPDKNWMHLPRSSLVIFSSLTARIGSSFVNQNLVCWCPLNWDHSLHQISTKWSSMEGIITFLVGSTSNTSLLISPAKNSTNFVWSGKWLDKCQCWPWFYSEYRWI